MEAQGSTSSVPRWRGETGMVERSCALPCLQAFINRDDLDFSMVSQLPAVQEWELVENLGGQIEYPTQ